MLSYRSVLTRNPLGEAKPNRTRLDDRATRSGAHTKLGNLIRHVVRALAQALQAQPILTALDHTNALPAHPIDR